MRKSHPWRGIGSDIRTIDPIINIRSSQFAAFLDTLPSMDRRQIEAAERMFVTRTNLVTSSQQSAARDYAGGMLGVKENEPVEYHGFVV